MKILGNEIKPGMIIEHKNDLWSVLKAQHVKPGKGGAFNQVELKSVKKGTKLNERFRSNDTVERAILNDKKFSFLYEDEKNCHFMDQNNFEQIICFEDFGEKQGRHRIPEPPRDSRTVRPKLGKEVPRSLARKARHWVRHQPTHPRRSRVLLARFLPTQAVQERLPLQRAVWRPRHRA